MEISDELLAAYAEGNVTEPERDAVRQYLAEHPEELETMLIMMDKDYELNLHAVKERHSDNIIDSPGHVDAGSIYQRLEDLFDETAKL